ncbi:MAG: T9SS type A sorting domain-containing protein [Candidatus Eisenbacteria bacterium]|uniref:T9SS type A sorting domain-containing protein n=1 Tax=Eiseniibacteriota bacterium TaxID=2212470 RepID=A0A7Y2H2Z3_UNCEI|nr:T9SS type A sorting domain-containing protein [Candidatus Eisenbacteria bacterium]
MKTARPFLMILLLVVFTAGPAIAGGPLLIFDAATKTPYAYPGPVSVYTDLGDLGVMTNASADAMVTSVLAEWSGVSSSSFSASVTGDFASVSLPDITSLNASTVIGTFNGGGVHVIYDDDGMIISGVIGAPPGVLGVATPEFFAAGTKDIAESWVVLNGTSVDPGDPSGIMFEAVPTHEFGHAINLAHTEVNGAIVAFGETAFPDGCMPPPPPAAPPGFAEVATMYPFLSVSVSAGVGVEYASLEKDDMVSLSDLYPAPGYPGTFGSFAGTVFQPDGLTPIQGVNVVARNVLDPFGDAVAQLTGAFTQGALGEDGSFLLQGLTDGEAYVLYIDDIVAGGFSVTPAGVPDFAEEYFNDALESSDPGTDLPCDFTLLSADAAFPLMGLDIIVNDPYLILGDDDTEEVALPFAFPFCGAMYTSVWVNSNGNITFGAGDTDFTESVAEFLSGPPRIAALWADFDPATGGSITTEDVGGAFVISWVGVAAAPIFGTPPGPSTFSITLIPDGSFTVDYGAVGQPLGLAGRSPGGGAPDPGETDLTLEPEPIVPFISPVYELFDAFDNDLVFETLEYGSCDTGPTDVELAAFVATRLPNGSASVSWVVSDAHDHLGFDVYRGESEVSRERINGAVLRGQDSYMFEDAAAPKVKVGYWLAELSRSGTQTWHGPVWLSPAVPVSGRQLLASPNPFASQTRITYQLHEARPVRLDVFDLKGRKVRTLLQETQSAGERSVVWDGSGESGSKVATGFYLLRLEAGPDSQVRKVLVRP